MFEYFTEEEIQKARFLVANCDGLVLPGGLETRPYELLIARMAYQMKKPILAMCAGQNALVRALDGSTMQLSKEEAMLHNNEKIHKVHNAYAVVGTDYEKMVGSDPFAVNSIHSYVIENPGPYLDILGYDDQDHIEVVGNRDCSDHFVIASRFHPETLFKMIESSKLDGASEEEIYEMIEDNHASYMMFASFIKACEKNKLLNPTTMELNDSQLSSLIYPDVLACEQTEGKGK